MWSKSCISSVSVYGFIEQEGATHSDVRCWYVLLCIDFNPPPKEPYFGAVVTVLNERRSLVMIFMRIK
jgi:hypothetical protein